jgi:hypothetical protein
VRYQQTNDSDGKFFVDVLNDVGHLN